MSPMLSRRALFQSAFALAAGPDVSVADTVKALPRGVTLWAYLRPIAAAIVEVNELYRGMCPRLEIPPLDVDTVTAEMVAELAEMGIALPPESAQGGVEVAPATYAEKAGRALRDVTMKVQLAGVVQPPGPPPVVITSAQQLRELFGWNVSDDEFARRYPSARAVEALLTLDDGSRASFLVDAAEAERTTLGQQKLGGDYLGSIRDDGTDN